MLVSLDPLIIFSTCVFLCLHPLEVYVKVRCNFESSIDTISKKIVWSSSFKCIWICTFSYFTTFDTFFEGLTHDLILNSFMLDHGIGPSTLFWKKNQWGVDPEVFLQVDAWCVYLRLICMQCWRRFTMLVV